MRQTVYDLPTRLFHWLFAGLFIVAFFIAKTIDDESALYAYHMLSGILLSFLVLLRIVWGIFGTRHAQFKGFALNPHDLIQYFKSIVTGKKRKWAGHNPASSWAALIMMAFALGLGITGYLMTSGGDKEAFEDLHELLANGFIVMAVMHVAGILLHSIRYQDKIALSMIDGKKQDISSGEAISSTQSTFGILFVALVVAFAINLKNNYNSQNQTLNILGTTLQLGENEDGENENSETKADRDHKNDDHDGDDD